jgi:hypothetical protein
VLPVSQLSRPAHEGWPRLAGHVREVANLADIQRSLLMKITHVIGIPTWPRGFADPVLMPRSPFRRTGCFGGSNPLFVGFAE